MALRPDTLFWEGWAIPQHISEQASLKNLGFRPAPAAACGLQSSGTLEVGEEVIPLVFAPRSDLRWGLELPAV